MPPSRLPGVFCLEGSWSNLLTDGSSVRHVLDLLESLRLIRYAHRDAATVEEFETYMTQWAQKQYASLAFGYLGFHGSPGCIHIGRKSYDLERLAELMEGRLEGRILYFGSCQTLDVEADRVMDLIAASRVRAVCGYTTVVDWVESAAFDLNLIDAVSRYTRIDGGFKYLYQHHHGACERLGFRAYWATGTIGAP